MLKREFLGIAIGGLSGGEAKEEFVKVIEFCTKSLPPLFPRYCMGVGFSIDMLICIALGELKQSTTEDYNGFMNLFLIKGIDMFDCVYPTRTARFGSALIESGQKLSLRHRDMANDFSVSTQASSCVTSVKLTVV
jgi:queuine/archaeosine tRNA-ribosyltransferase